MAFLSALLAGQAGQATGEMNAYQDAIKKSADEATIAEQKRVDDSTIDKNNADSAYYKAHGDEETADWKRKNIEDGVGLAPFQPKNFGQKGTLTLKQQAQNARDEATYYRTHGAKSLAPQAETTAKDLDTRATAAEKDAETVTRDANNLLGILARNAHLSREDQLAGQRIIAQQAEALQRGETTIERARMEIAGAAQRAIGQENAAMQRTVVAQRGADGRTVYVQQNDNARAIAQQQNADAIARFVQGSDTYRDAMKPGYEPPAGQTQPNINFNPTIVNSPTMAPVQDPTVKPPTGDAAKAAAAQKAKADAALVDTVAGQAAKNIARGVPIAQILDIINNRSPDLTPAMKQEIIRRISSGRTPTPAPPSPVNAPIPNVPSFLQK